MSTPLRILYLEDDFRDRELAVETLARDGFACEFVFASGQQDFVAGLETEPLDVILSDYTLPAYSGMEALAVAQELRPEVPFLFLTGTMGEDRAVEGLRGGATDYVVKNNLDRLGPVVRRALEEAELKKGRRQLEQYRSAIADLGFSLSTAVTGREAAQIIAGTTERLLRWDVFVLVLWVSEHGRLEPVLRLTRVDGAAVSQADEGQDDTSAALLTRAIAEGPQFEAAASQGESERPSYRMAVPIRAALTITGALCVQSYGQNAYRPDDLQTLQALADHCGSALERIRAQMAERETRAILEKAQSVAHLGSWTSGMLPKAPLFWSEEVFRIFGVAESDFDGRVESFFERVHPEDRERVREASRKAREERLPFAIDHRIVRPDGGVRWVHEKAEVVRDSGGRPLRMIGVIQDITERKEAEFRLEVFSALGQRLSMAQNAKEAAQIIVEAADRLLGWDACICDLYSRTKDVLIPLVNIDVIDGKRMDCCPPPGTSLPAAGLSAKAIREGAQLILRGTTQTAEELDHLTVAFGDVKRKSESILFVPIRDNQQVVGVLSIQSYKVNAYDRRHLETLQALADHCAGALNRIHTGEALRATQDRLDHLLAESPAVIYCLEIEGGILRPSWVSASLEQLLGFTPREACQPQWWLSRVHPEDLASVEDSLCQLANERQLTRDYRIRHRNGEYRWIRDEQRLVFDPTRSQAEILGSWVDITDRKALEELLRHSQKMEAIGQLAGGVAHDFNNLLAVMLGNTELALMDSSRLPLSVCESLRQVVVAAERAANLTRQLLAFGRKQLIRAEPLNLNDLIANLSRMLERIIGENITLECVYADKPALITGDLSMIEQVLLNLVVNGRDAMPQGGRLKISTELAEIDAAYAAGHPEARIGSFVRLAVSDTGVGIPPQHLPHVFEPFFTTKEVGKGTGLGLSMVYGIVKQHQGWVELDSQVGTGTTINIYLPAKPGSEPPRSVVTGNGGVAAGNERILLVEDDFALRTMTERLLETFGYKVWKAASGQEALEIWQQHGPEVDLLLTDIIMPGNINGRELAEKLRAERPDLPVILMSGYSADVGGGSTELAQRFNGYFLQKPCPSQIIVETVRRCLDARAAVSEPG